MSKPDSRCVSDAGDPLLAGEVECAVASMRAGDHGPALDLIARRLACTAVHVRRMADAAIDELIRLDADC